MERIASFFQFLQDSGTEIERRVNEMDKAGLPIFHSHPRSNARLQHLEDHTMPDRERLKLFNKLCKTCSRHRVIPKSMHIPDCSEGSVEVEYGGFATSHRVHTRGVRWLSRLCVCTSQTIWMPSAA
jgi:hypothetical protein